MAIDETFLERIVAFGTEQGVLKGGSTAILGDCRFLTSWASGDNSRDLLEFQKRFGLARVETFDIASNPTVRLDLHAPLSESLRGQFDLVIDAGTMHCCFDVAQVLENALGLMKSKAGILHVSAFAGFTGRCYYKIDPSMLSDFYNQNGFEKIEMWVKAGVKHGLWYRLRLKLRRLCGLSAAALQKLSDGAFQLQDANAYGFEFTNAPQGAGPALLPNDTVIICAAWREVAVPFTRPIPSYFTSQQQ